MASIGSLTADLRLESAAFLRDIKKAQTAVASNTAAMRKSMQQVERATRSLSQQLGQLRNAAAALAGVLAVRQFAQVAESAINATDAIAKQSKQLQFAASELQRYRIEGELAGVATQKLDSGIGAFVKRVGELRAGTGTLTTMLDKSNVALKQQLLAARSTEEGFQIMLKAIRETGSAFDKQALSAAAFGRQAGQAMVLLAQDVGKLSDEMAQLVTRSDEVLKASERLNDDLTSLRRAYSAGFDSAVIEGLVGAFDASADSMRAARRAGEQFGEIVAGTLRAVAAAARFVVERFTEIKAALTALVAFKASQMFIGIALAVGKLAVALRGAVSAQAALNLVMRANPIGAVATAVSALVAGYILLRDRAKEAAVAIGEASRAELKRREAELEQRIALVDRQQLRLPRTAGDYSVLQDQRHKLEKDLFTIRQRLRELAEAGKVAGDSAAVMADEVVTAAESVTEAATETKRATKVLSEAAKQAQAIRESTEALRLEASQTEQLIGALKRGEDAYRQAARAIDIQNDALKLGVDLTTQQGQEWLDAATRARDLRRDLDDLKDSQQAAADAARAHAEEQKRLREEQSRIAIEPFLNAVRGIQDAFVGLFEGIFSGGVDSFKGLARAVKQIMIRLAAEIAALMVFRPVVAGILGSVGLGAVATQMGLGGAGALGFSASGGGLGALGNLGGLLGSSQLGIAGADLAVRLGLGNTGQMLLGNLGASVPAIFAGTAISQLLGLGKGTGGAIGGTIGGTIGGAAFGPIGAVGGSVLGSIFGGLFGGKPKRQTGGARIDAATGAILSAGAKASTPDAAIQLGQQLSTILQTFADITGATIRPSGIGVRTVANAKKVGESPFSLFTQGFGTAAGRLDFATEQALLQQGALELIRSTRFTKGVPKEFEAAIKGATSAQQLLEQAQAIAAVTKARKEEAEALKEQERVIRLQVRGAQAQATGTILDFLRGQSLSADSSLSPTGRLAEAQRQFGDLLAQVRGGNLGQVGALTQTAGTLLSIGRENFASTVDFAALERSVRSSLLNLSNQVASESFFNAQVEATRQQTDVLQDEFQALTGVVREMRNEIRTLRQQMAA